ncbi:NADH-FMN oxidoreductase RutF, flavin reductase (DIM6/NTAB) family [Loktanella sp. DSM 29012]|uniref:Flavin reductase family protein n=1 Tax=Loktanella gaetbuli TaxID=2881335 RepID=A0ABS8BWR6_9RHOB|nr:MULTISPECIES: flavin reductase family protein [Loktanella]MCB5200139.1 flavin reductase family protein [Loktanella gaetbuli]SEP79747.1 NADH-FMN oxidoreductase RutF, flavin reductase (DIM6/NTAB) family [Loktanella sp. DSM 29012]
MFYRPKDGHDLPHNPFNALVTPRPIGWISTRGADGRDNLAPYSFFNAVAYTPPQVMFASLGAKPDRPGTKDSLANINDTGVFACNVVSFDLKEQMNHSSGGWRADVDEFELTGLEKGQCTTIDCPFVAAAPAVLECELRQIIKLEGAANYAVFGEVVGIHIDDRFIKDGMFDVTAVKPVSRLGYRDFSVVENVFEMGRPGE